jgi:hypothetical protein
MFSWLDIVAYFEAVKAPGHREVGDDLPVLVQEVVDLDGKFGFALIYFGEIACRKVMRVPGCYCIIAMIGIIT